MSVYMQCHAITKGHHYNKTFLDLVTINAIQLV